MLFSQPSSSVLNRRHYAWLSVSLTLFVIYGSLVPLHFQPLSLADAADRFGEVVTRPLRLESPSDTLANVVLVVPLGFFLMGMLCVDRHRLASLAASAAFLVCLTLSVAVEFAQLWVPARVSSLNDIVAQAVGSAAGIALWLTCGQRLTVWFRGVWAGMGGETRAVRLLPAYLVLLVLIHGMPFDLTLSPAQIYRKFRHGRIGLVPFADYGVDLWQGLSKECWNVALFLPLGMLLEHLPGLNCHGPRAWPRILGLGVTMTMLLQVLKLFVISRYVDLTNVLTGSAAILAGWALGLALRRRLATGLLDRRAPFRLDLRQRAHALAALLFLPWLAMALLVNWQPFDFSLDAGQAAERLRHISLVPFLDYYEGNYWNSFDQLVHKTLLFLPVGAILTLFVNNSDPSRRTRFLALLPALAIAVLIETGQLFLPTRYASLTDILVESAGAWLGLILALRCQWRFS